MTLRPVILEKKKLLRIYFVLVDSDQKKWVFEIFLGPGGNWTDRARFQTTITSSSPPLLCPIWHSSWMKKPINYVWSCTHWKHKDFKMGIEPTRLTTLERRWNVAEVGGAAKWRDVDRLSTSIRLNILHADIHIHIKESQVRWWSYQNGSTERVCDQYYAE